MYGFGFELTMKINMLYHIPCTSIWSSPSLAIAMPLPHDRRPML